MGGEKVSKRILPLREKVIKDWGACQVKNNRLKENSLTAMHGKEKEEGSV